MSSHDRQSWTSVIATEVLESRRLLSDVPVGQSPVGVVTGDFNGDGRIDLASVNRNSAGNSSVSIALGDGRGGFGAATAIAVAGTPTDLAVGNFNSDAVLDLAVVRQNLGVITPLFGQGNGAFTVGSNVPVASNPVRITIGDFNSDGRSDLATISPGTGSTSTVSVVLGIAGGLFFSAPITTSVSGNTGLSLVAANLNTDTIPDLAVATSNATGPASPSVAILLGQGNGSFTVSGSPIAVDSPPQMIVAVDLNGDTNIDLATANRGGTLSLLTGNGFGAFAATSTPTGVTSPSGLAISDVDLDGLPDLLVGSSAPSVVGKIAVLRNNAEGPFSPPTFSAMSLIDVAANPAALTTADVNADGRVDIVAVQDTLSALTVLFGTGGGGFTPAVLSAPLTFNGLAAPGPIASGDFDNDGRLDIAEAGGGGTGQVALFRGNGSGGFALPSVSTVGANPVAIVAADFNNDGNLDLAIATSAASGSLSILRGNGDGTFAAALTLSGVVTAADLVAGDFNGDEKIDLAVSNNVLSGAVTTFYGNGNGTFGTAVTTNLGGGQFPVEIAAADFNSDGLTDLVTGNNSATGPNVSLLTGQAGGGFAASSGPALGGVATAVALADFNGDDRADLAVATDGNGGRYHILPGDGQGGFAFAAPYVVGAPVARALVAADFNNDGKADLGAANGTGLTILLGDGLGQITAFPPRTVAAARYLATGDYNGDGRLDLATSAGTGGSALISVALNAMPGPTPIATVSGGVLTMPAGKTFVDFNESAGIITLAAPFEGVTQYVNASAVRVIETHNQTYLTSDLGRAGGLRNVSLTVAEGVTQPMVSQHIDALTILSGGTLAMLTGSPSLLRVRSLAITGGTLDLATSDLIYDYSGSTPQQSTIRGLIAAGRNGGDWLGTGLTSSAIPQTANAALGYLEATDYKSIYGTSATFAGETLDTTAVIVRQTLYGDSDLNRAVTISDFNYLAIRFGAIGGQNWLNGDYDFDGDVTISDFNLLAINFGETF